MMKLFLKIFNSLFSCARLWCVNINDEQLYEETGIKEFKFKVIKSPEILNKLKIQIAQERGEQYVRLIESRINNGTYWCFLFEQEPTGDIAYTRWTCRDEYFSDSMNLSLTFNSDEIFTQNSYTHPKYRKLGLHREMNLKMLNYIKKNTEYSKVYMVIRCFLPHLVKIPRALGYIPVKTTVFYKSGSFSKTVKKIF